MMDYYGGMAMMWPWMLTWTLVAVAGLVALILVIVRLARGDRAAEFGHNSGSARRILDERYAHGEIDHDDYQKRRDMLR